MALLSEMVCTKQDGFALRHVKILVRLRVCLLGTKKPKSLVRIATGDESRAASGLRFRQRDKMTIARGPSVHRAWRRA